MRRGLQLAAGLILLTQIPQACRLIEAVHAICDTGMFNAAEAARNVDIALAQERNT